MTKGTVRRIEKIVEIATQLGMAAVIGGTADAVVDGTRKGLDLFGIIMGALSLAVAVWLTGRVNGDKL
ncbi:MAG: hypothetical protein HYT87_13255 [Nitrospirae bacterium]|nr:hypothetical protein [Nitrospirota bacterium]